MGNNNKNFDISFVCVEKLKEVTDTLLFVQDIFSNHPETTLDITTHTTANEALESAINKLNNEIQRNKNTDLSLLKRPVLTH